MRYQIEDTLLCVDNTLVRITGYRHVFNHNQYVTTIYTIRNKHDKYIELDRSHVENEEIYTLINKKQLVIYEALYS